MLRRRVTVIAALLALALLSADSADGAGPGISGGTPAGRDEPATAMTWTAISRFGGDANGDGLLDAGRFRNPGKIPVALHPSPRICERHRGVSWLVDGHPREGVEISGGRRCRAVLTLSRKGPHDIEVRAGDLAEVAHVDVDDRFIVALGDSVAAGEGTPTGAREWLDPGCHRSAAAGFELAARKLAQVSRQTSITFVSLACSGAEVGAGLLGPYVGIDPSRRPVKGPYPAQVDVLEALAAARGGGRGAVDAVLLSVGANDLGFGEVVATCAAPGDCREQKGREVFSALERLPESYDRLGRRLQAAAPRVPVLIDEYFDPTHDEDGAFCGLSVAFTSEDEVRWAYEGLLRPLNVEIAAAAVRNGWDRIGGIPARFERHGYCTDSGERWVRRLSESVEGQGDLKGTMHPNERGQLEIGWMVLPQLAAALHLPVPHRPPEATSGISTAQTLGLIALALLLTAALTLLVRTLESPPPLEGWPRAILHWLLFVVTRPFVLTFFAAVRLLRLLRPTDSETPGPAPEPLGELKPPPKPRTAWQGALAIGGIVVFILLAALFARQVGSTILWLRFWSSNLPADQAVAGVSQRELLIVGAQELAIFIALGLIAAGCAWLLDSRGSCARPTRRGLVAIGLVEILVAILIGHFRGEQAERLFAGIVLAALLIYYLVDRALMPVLEPGSRKTVVKAVGERWSSLWSAPRREFLAALPLRLWHLVPFAILALAVWWTTAASGHDRDVLPFAFLLAALLFVAPGGLASPGTKSRTATGEQLKTLVAPRIGLALAAVACIAILVIRDEAWLAATATMALFLGLLCLAISIVSDNRFWPYGLAVLVSVPLFGAGAAMVRGLDTPELQPVAVVTHGGRSVCGAYVGESDGRLWMARLSLAEEADERRPSEGSLFSLDADRVATRLLGPLVPATRTEAEAVELRDELLDERRERRRARWPTCSPPPTVVRAQQSWQRRLAQRYQPELVIDRRDGFWPVPVKTLFSVADRRAGVCRLVAEGERNCLRLTTQGRFPWAGGQGESIEYPADDTDAGAQHDQMVAALGSADPDATATEYFLVAGGRRQGEPITIQYWFFYPFNYQPLRGKVLHGGFHEGDFESVGVLLSAHRHEPRYFWMARHDQEGRALPWDDDALSMNGNHPVVFVARGSHASYETCSDQIRFAAPYHLIDDHPTCDPDRQLHLDPAVTGLTDLSKVAWACWHGNFGHRSGGRAYEEIPYLVNDAPLSPLWQQHFAGVVSEPCRGIPDPGGRDGPGEEVLEESDRVPAELRKRAGRLQPLVDECADWEVPPPTGTFMLACDPASLHAYVERGLEGPSNEVRIEAVGRPRRRGQGSLPAMRDNRSGVYLDEWRVVGQRPARVTIFASCPHEGKIVAVRFAGVRLTPGEPLRLLDQTPDGWWRLIREDGSRVARARPFPTKEERGHLVRAPSNGERLFCTAG